MDRSRNLAGGISCSSCWASSGTPLYSLLCIAFIDLPILAREAASMISLFSWKLVDPFKGVESEASEKFAVCLVFSVSYEGTVL